MRSQHALRRSRDFRRVYGDGRKLRQDGLTVFVTPRDEPAAPSRLGLAVRGRLGTAVVRNKLKRRLREAFRRYSPGSGWDVVIRVESTGPVDYEELSHIVSNALRQAGVKQGAQR